MKSRVGTLLIELLLVVLAFLLLQRSCKVEESYRRQLVRYEQLKAQVAKERKTLLDEIKQKEAYIEELEQEVQASEVKIKELEEKSNKSKHKLAVLEREYNTLKSDQKKVENLLKQVEEWKHRFNLAQATIQEKDKIIFSLKAKYEAQLKISEKWRTAYEQEYALRLSCEEVLKECTKTVASLKWRTTAGVVSIAIIAGIVVFAFK